MKKSMKKWLAAGLAGLLALAAVAAYLGMTAPRWERPEGLSRGRQREIQGEIRKIEECCKTEADRMAVDKIEYRLLAGGFPVLDTDGVYPAYLGHPQGLRRFWEDVQAGKKAETSLIRVTEDGSIFLSRFFHQGADTTCVLTKTRWAGEKLEVVSCEYLPVYDMELADWDVFYYRLYPKDPHYIDYMQVRLTPPDREKYDLCRKYILPVGYQMVNLFLVDWAEGDWGALSFNDLLESLYAGSTGEPWGDWTVYADPENTLRARIPAAVFEDAVMPYFSITREKLRELAGYQEETDSYPWRPFYGDDLTTLSFPMCEPQVVEAVWNEDGTLTLSVRVASPENKTDCLFSHTLVVRPMAGGGFQYVSNQVTWVGQWGLPFAQPRLRLN